MKTVLLIIGILLIGLLAYKVIFSLLSLQVSTKRKRLSQVLREFEKVEQTNKLSNWLKKRNLLHLISPKMIMDESEKYGQKINMSSFFSTFLIGFIVGIIVFIVYLKSFIFLIPLSLIGGFIAVNIKLHTIKKEYLELLNSKLSIYMSSVATAINTFGNIRGTMQSVIPTLEQPIKNDVEQALMYLQDGKDVRTSFADMNQKYQSKELTHFHEQLDIIIKSGATSNTTLRELAQKMKGKVKYHRQLETAHREGLRNWRTFVFLTLSVPFLMIFLSFENFLTITGSPIFSFGYLIAFALMSYSYKKIKDLELYDPTTDVKNIKL